MDSLKEAAIGRRKFEVTATDEKGDVWTYATDDRERAEAMLADMQDDFESAEMIEHRRSGNA